LECKEAFKALIKEVNPTKSFSVISHSFGSGVTAYTLSETTYKIEKLIFLTNPNRVEHIFEDFKKMIRLGDKAYSELLQLTARKLGEPISAVSVENKLKKVDFEQLILIHDKYDKVLAFSHSLQVKLAFPQAEMVKFEKVGHYKMLWNDEVVAACIKRIQEPIFS
jgi:pimeloyl-ACP methyl ester carboxylesterase